ncbi:MAG: hypothetical protein M0R22_00390 [Dehalococcoidia bacterium]|jgi:hypothetical protein|nr:hypothetical protein [Dehalococcoidia bacterium]
MMKFTHWANDPGCPSIGLESSDGEVKVALFDLVPVSDCIGGGYQVTWRGTIGSVGAGAVGADRRAHGASLLHAYGASLLHALELGVAAAARWIAVELLRDSTPPGEGERTENVSLYTVFPTATPFSATLWLTGLGHAGTIGQVSMDEPLAGVNVFRASWLADNDGPVDCASSEQALAALIEHAAPWIATALAKEIES